MDNKFYQDDELEQFLQDEVKQHRMYPSDHIWKNIRTELHGYKAWPALTFISLFIITALTITTLLNNHPGSHLTAMAPANTLQNNTANTNVAQADEKTTEATNYFEKNAPAQLTAETFANREETPDANTVTRNSSIDYAAVPVKAFTTTDHSNYTDKIYKAPATNAVNLANLQNTLIASNTATISEDNTTENTGALLLQENITEQPAADQQTKKDYHPSADEFLKDFDYVRNTPKPRNSKFGFQFYVTPSQSYRRLSDEKVKEVIQPATTAAPSSGTRSIPLSSNYSADVNDVVRHKPAMGFEMGFSILYNMNPRLKFKTGLQLNVRQYYIETFQSTNDLASLSLINYTGVETISFYSPYNNNTGYRKTQLDNKIYQLSVPVGVQWDMVQGKHLGITAEGSVQPTLTLNTNTYLLSTDYKHYTGGDNFIRKWNINTSVGINLTYKSGASSWQIGPQVRYQHLPTYSNLYPIKEYLIDYGVRLGFTRQIK